jgi:porin
LVPTPPHRRLGGLRDDLAKKGVVFDNDLLLTPQDVVSGGRSTGGDLWGNIDYTLNIDTQKLGLWPGGFFKFQSDTGFGSNVFKNAGTIVPVNTAALIPGINDQTTALMNATLTQFLSPQFALFAGKINMLGSGVTEFYGDYRTQFLNAMFIFPMTLEQVPISAFGGGAILIPQQDILLSALALDPDGTPTSNDLGHAFSDGVEVLASGKLTIKPFGLVGHQSLGLSWNNKQRFSLIQDPTNTQVFLLQSQFPRLANPGPVLAGILERFFPALLVPVQPPNRESSSWALSYSFGQYFWQPDGDPKHGIGFSSALAPPTGTRTRSSTPSSPESAAKVWCRAVLTTLSDLALHGPSSAALSRPFCASSSTSASSARTRSRCTTMSRSRNGSTSPATCRSLAPASKKH